MASGTSRVDLAFAMDCTGSMASYIKNATDNIRLMVDEIMNKEKVTIRLALIEFRDHPPQDVTFVTRVHNFTDSVAEAKIWLDKCEAKAGGDIPEAIADALNDVLNLSWNSGAVKICILISDAPPHGLDPKHDSFPNGCPLGHDPLAIARKMAEKHITLYTAGVEPPILPYRDFYMTLTHITGGQYVPMRDANRLAQMIIAGVREEISLDRLMHSAHGDITSEMRRATNEKTNDNETATRLQRVFNSKKLSVNRMNNTVEGPSKQVEECYSKCLDMADIQKHYKKMEPAANRTATDMDYKLEEQQAVTIGQTKHHRAKFSHPEHDDNHSSTRSHVTNSDHINTRNPPTNSHTINDPDQTRCPYGSRCHDHSEYHRTQYSHNETDNHSKQRNQQRKSDNFNTRFSHNDRSSQNNQQTTSHNNSIRHQHWNTESDDTDQQLECKNGKRCTDHSEYHRTQYTHPI